MSIQLPHSPKQETYEDLIVACLLGQGYFIEANLHLREDTTEILELDVVATPMNSPLDDAILLDAKSGKTGFADVFKLFGWRTYLGIEKACVVTPHHVDPDKLEALRVVERQTNVATATINLNEFSLVFSQDQNTSLDDAMRKTIINNAWLGRIGKRLCIQAFTPFTKRSDLATAPNARDYRWAVEQSFFVKRPLDRARAIYKAYKQFGNITGRVIEEINAKNSKVSVESMWDEVRDTATRKELQFCLMLEHTARLRIIKNSMIHLIQREADGEGDPGLTNSLFAEWTMPASFRKGIERMQACEFRKRLPYLWQLFIEVFGGFYSLKDSCDLELLSAASGIPLEHVESCLLMYEDFFPNSKGWFMDSADEIRIMKNVPAVYHGTGALLREQICFGTSYTERHTAMAWLVKKWAKSLHNLVHPELNRK